jgi:hypothetical protein
VRVSGRGWPVPFDEPVIQVVGARDEETKPARFLKLSRSQPPIQ